MAEDRDDLLRHYRSTREELLAALDGISDELMIERSLDGWSVKDHLAHMALWDDVRASEVLRISAGFDSRAGDPLGQFTLNDQDFADLTDLLVAIAREHAGGRLISVLEGGYAIDGLAKAVDTHLGRLAV